MQEGIAMSLAREHGGVESEAVLLALKLLIQISYTLPGSITKGAIVRVLSLGVKTGDEDLVLKL